MKIVRHRLAHLFTANVQYSKRWQLWPTSNEQQLSGTWAHVTMWPRLVKLFIFDNSLKL